MYSNTRVKLVSTVSLFTSFILVCAPFSPIMSEPTGDVQKKLTTLSREAEKISDKVNALTEKQNKALKEIKTLKTEIVNNDKQLVSIRQKIIHTKPQIKKFVNSTYQGERFSKMYSILITNSPQQLLDQMTVTQEISEYMDNKVSTYKNDKILLKDTNNKNSVLIKKKQDSSDKLDEIISDLTIKKNDLNTKIYSIKIAYGLLSPTQRLEYANGSGLSPAQLKERLKSLPKGIGLAAIVVQAALSQVGKPYVWGGTSPASGFDCSGLVMWAFAQAGVSLPRTSQAQSGGGVPVSRGELQPGDVIIYYSDASHVGLYVGNGMVVHAPTFGMPVQVVPLDNAGPFAGARRYVN